jgi:hypothetical protein
MFDLTDEDSLDWMRRGREGVTEAEQVDLNSSAGYNDTFGTKDAAAATRYSEGDEVDTPQGPGVVVEIRTEAFEGPGGSDVEPSDNSPAYVVAVKSGAEVYRADDLSDGTISVDGVSDPAGDLADDAEAGGVDAANPDDGRRFDYPDSWDESPTPNRIILLKAWAGLGGRFTSCRRKMAGDVASPARFCASMKDRVLMWEGWRQGG